MRDQYALWGSRHHPFQGLPLPSDEHCPLIIIGADWNATASLADVWPSGVTNTAFPSSLEFLRDQHQVIDLFRYHSPDTRQYSRLAVQHGTLLSARRLDSVWASPQLLPRLQRVHFHTFTSDHRAVLYELSPLCTGSEDDNDDESHQLGPGFWRLHPGVLDDENFRQTLLEWASHVQCSLLEFSPVPALTNFLDRLRTVVFQAASQVGRIYRDTNRQLRSLQDVLSRTDLSSPAARSAFIGLHSDMLRLTRRAAVNQSMGIRSPLSGSAFRPDAWTYNTAQSRGSTVIPSLVDDSGVEVTQLDRLPFLVSDFFSGLFRLPNALPDRADMQDQLLQYTQQRLTSQESLALARSFTDAEFHLSLRYSRDESSSGGDGLPYGLLRLLAPTLLPLLCKAVDSLMEGEVLPASLCRLRGVLLPKSGDRASLANYRPLSIANTTSRLVGRVIADRLQQCAHIQATYQSGFIRDRSGDDSAILLHLVTYAARHQKCPPFILCLLDQTKAYDRVDREWLTRVLRHMGFPSRFIHLLQGIYQNALLSFAINGWLSPPVHLDTGLLQGDPASPLLYNLVLQPMLEAIAADGLGVRFPSRSNTAPGFTVPYLAFADDVVTFIHTEADSDALFRRFSQYGTASNGLLSHSKSRTFLFGNDSDGQLADLQARLPLTLATTDDFLYLGHPFSARHDGPSVGLFQARLDAIVERRLTLVTTGTALFTRIRIVATLLLPKLWHHIRLAPTPTNFLAQVVETFRPYLWLGRKPWVKLEYLFAPKHVGGFGMVHPIHMLIANFGAVLARWFQRTDAAGDFFRNCLHDYLWDMGATEGIFLVRGGAKWRQLNSRLSASQSFWGKACWVLAQLGVELQPIWAQYTLEELLTIPFIYQGLVGFHEWLQESNTLSCTQSQGLFLFGDVIWYYSVAWRYPREFPINTLPLSPPPFAALKLWEDSIRHIGPFNQTLRFRAVAPLYHHWNIWYASLPEAVRRTFATIPHKYWPKSSRSTSRLNPQTHVKPWDWDVSTMPFPWRHIKLGGVPLKQYSVKRARGFLARSAVIQPDWPFESNSAEWAQVWRFTSQKDLLLDDDAFSHLMCFQHRRVHCAKRWPDEPSTTLPDRPPTPEEEADLPTETSSYAKHFQHTSQPRYCPPVDTEPADPLLALEESLDVAPDAPAALDHRRGYCLSVGCNDRDSALHGFLECPAVHALWQASLPILADLLNASRAPPLDSRSIVLGWYALGIKAVQRWRLFLWRSAVLVTISKRRAETLAASRRLGRRVDIDWDVTKDGFVTAVRLNVVQRVVTAWDHVLSCDRIHRVVNVLFMNIRKMIKMMQKEKRQTANPSHL